jgi:DNA-binding PadR family transcriptional regulator
MARLAKKTLDGNMESLLLSVLEAGPSYGYQIIQDLNALGDGLLAMGEGTVYPVLHRMEERGLIVAAWRVSEAGRRRKYYRITPRGRKSMAENQAQWLGLRRLMDRVHQLPMKGLPA